MPAPFLSDMLPVAESLFKLRESLYMLNKIKEFIKKEIILCISGALALLSVFFVKPDREYINYIDFRVLAILFCLMLAMAGLQKEGIFKIIGNNLLKRTTNIRQLAFTLVFLCFFFSMLITNDVSLITFVPFAIMVLESAKKTNYIIYIVVLQTIAANLGSMFTPVGNPQNLYLYGMSQMTIMEFLKHMLIPVIISAILLMLSVAFIKNDKIDSDNILKDNIININKNKVAAYIIIFVISLLCVARILPYQVMLVTGIIIACMADYKIIKSVDWLLLITFVNFFIFIGNMGRLDIIRESIKGIINGHEMLVGILSSQIISNVPSAMLLSEFTENYGMLIWGVNIGGLGTIIASMASLISYKFYANSPNGNNGRYMGVFTIMNLIYMILIVGFMKVLGYL